VNQKYHGDSITKLKVAYPNGAQPPVKFPNFQCPKNAAPTLNDPSY